MAERNEFQEPVSPWADELDAVLRQLRPKASEINRDRLMFLAGQASASRTLNVHRRRTWAAAALAIAASLLVAMLLAYWPEPRVIREVVYIDRPVPAMDETQETVSPPRLRQSRQSVVGSEVESVRTAEPADFAIKLALPAESWLNLQQLILAEGVEGLPVSAEDRGGASAILTSHELLARMHPPADLGPERPLLRPRSPLSWSFFGSEGESQ